MSKVLSIYLAQMNATVGAIEANADRISEAYQRGAAEAFHAGGSVLALDKIGPVTAADRGNLTSLLLRQATGSVPSGTRRVELEILASRDSGTVNDAYADNLSLVFTLTP